MLRQSARCSSRSATIPESILCDGRVSFHAQSFRRLAADTSHTEVAAFFVQLRRDYVISRQAAFLCSFVGSIRFPVKHLFISVYVHITPPSHQCGSTHRRAVPPYHASACGRAGQATKTQNRTVLQAAP